MAINSRHKNNQIKQNKKCERISFLIKIQISTKNQTFIFSTDCFFVFKFNYFKSMNRNSLGIPTVLWLLLCGLFGLKTIKSTLAPSVREFHFSHSIAAQVSNTLRPCAGRKIQKDILTFMISLREISSRNARSVHIHTKKSLHS